MIFARMVFVLGWTVFSNAHLNTDNTVINNNLLLHSDGLYLILSFCPPVECKSFCKGRWPEAGTVRHAVGV